MSLTTKSGSVCSSSREILEGIFHHLQAYFQVYLYETGQRYKVGYTDMNHIYEYGAEFNLGKN